jgi:hypothetical protein
MQVFGLENLLVEAVRMAYFQHFPLVLSPGALDRSTALDSHCILCALDWVTIVLSLQKSCVIWSNLYSVCVISYYISLPPLQVRSVTYEDVQM